MKQLKLRKDGTPRKKREPNSYNSSTKITPEMLKQFWNHQINPITGWVTKSSQENHGNLLKYYQDNRLKPDGYNSTRMSD